MNNSTAWAVTSKWVSILEEYEKVKIGQSPLFTTVNDLCLAYHIHRKDIRKYYERWIKSGKDRSSLLSHKEVQDQENINYYQKKKNASLSRSIANLVQTSLKSLRYSSTVFIFIHLCQQSIEHSNAIRSTRSTQNQLSVT